jgi:hypothetical protein
VVAVATASNISSAATITGNPQNMLIGSLAGTYYVDFVAPLRVDRARKASADARLRLGVALDHALSQALRYLVTTYQLF